jgi:hypothetical protein
VKEEELQWAGCAHSRAAVLGLSGRPARSRQPCGPAARRAGRQRVASSASPARPSPTATSAEVRRIVRGDSGLVRALTSDP